MRPPNMRIAVRKESDAGERRVSIVPESIKRLAAKKIDVSIEAGAGGAGAGAFASDDEYRSSGARIDASLDALLTDADAVVQIRAPHIEDVKHLKEGSALVSLLFPLVNHDLVRALAARNITSIAVDMIPRTTVAQMMDVLSSQATAAGYEAVLMAAASLPRFFPMLMTAAGTIAPARVLILGAGVAGLQAIGTARRLGAVVEAFHVAKADVVLCTALVPGRRAPVLVTAEMVASMRAGSVIVDLAAEQQGNCALTQPGKTVVEHGVTIIGATDLTSRMCAHASQMYSRNMEKLLFYITKDGALKLDFKDEIVAGSVVTHAGEIVHSKVKEAMSPGSSGAPGATSPATATGAV